MRNRIGIYEPEVIKNHKITSYINTSKTGDANFKNHHVLEILNAEGCEDFINYIKWLDLARDHNLLVLSSLHHYYYDSEEMKNVKTVINIKELNRIRNIKKFLRSIFHILPKNSYFIGCFVDNKRTNGFELKVHNSKYKNNMSLEAVENGIVSKIPFLNMLYSLMDSRTNNFLSRTNITNMIKESGFKVLDMTELNGLTYFCAQRHGNKDV